MKRTAVQHTVDEAIVAICRGKQPELADVAGRDEEFLAAVRYHRIAPLAHVATRDPYPELAAQLGGDRSRALVNHLRTSALLAGVSQVLSGIQWLTFKGPVLSEFAHPVAGLRFYKDVDVLVAPGDFKEACSRLLDEGWRVLLSDESLGGPELPGEVALINGHGVVMDLHWAMEVSIAQRRRFPMTSEELLQRSVPVVLGPASTWMLSPADALVHVCQHAALAGATKLGHLLDADQLSRQTESWDEVYERAIRWGATVQVAAVLSRAHRLLGTPLPEDFQHRLGVRKAMSIILASVDRTWPINRLRQDASWARLVTRGLRPGLAKTLTSVVGRGANGAWQRLRSSDGRGLGAPASSGVVNAFLDRVDALSSP